MIRSVSIRRLENGFLISYHITPEGHSVDDPFVQGGNYKEIYAETAEQMATTIHDLMYTGE